MTINIEQAILNSIMFDNSILNSLEIKNIEWAIPLHGLVAKCVLWLKEKGKEFDFLVVHHYITRNNSVDEFQFLEIAQQTPMSLNTCKSYLEILLEKQKEKRVKNALAKI